MIRSSEVTLHRYNPKVTVDYELPSDQLQFTTLPKDIIKRDLENPHRYLVVIRVRNEVGGFFELDESEMRNKYTDQPKALLLRGYSVDPKLQGRGVGSGSLQALPDFIRNEFPAFEEVVLGVNVQNEPAKRLYERAGFTDTGRRVTGRNGEMIVMSLRV